MGSAPTKRAYLKWENNVGSDFLQLSDSTRGVLGWIDSDGIPQGNIVPPIATVPFLGTPGGPCQPTQTAVNSITGAFYSCSNGSWALVASTVGSLVSPVVSPNPLAFDTNINFKGPNPYTDVTRYGVRAVNQAVAPAVPGITVTINSLSQSAAISAASTFQNGDGVVIFGAGATNNVTTPTGLTITPSLISAGAGTGVVVNAPAGSTQYCYKIIARDKPGGLTAASSQVCTATGPASLGPQNVAVSGFTRSGSIVTATTSSAHGLVVGAWVNIGTPNVNGTDNLYFGGHFIVATVPDSIHFTYVTGNDVAGGAPASSGGGGTAYYATLNHLSWTSQPNAFEYYIYGRTNGSLTYLGTSRVQSTLPGAPDTTFDDFGSPSMDGAVAPYFVPSTPPASPLADPLVTIIVSGAGTTTLTLANTASTSVTSATILFDNAPNIATAAASTQFHSLLYFPSAANPYVVNSYLTIPSFVSMNIAGATLFLNDTMELNFYDKIYGMLGAQTSSALAFGYPVGGFILAGQANPAIYGGDVHNLYIYGIQVNSGQNGGVGMLLDQAANSSFHYVNFASGGTTDVMTIPLIIRATDFLISFDHIAYIVAQGSFFGSLPTPAFLYSGGNMVMSNLSFSGRGIFRYVPTLFGTGINIDIEGASRMQGGNQPFFTNWTTPAGVEGGLLGIRHFELDTTPHATFANLSSRASVMSVDLTGANQPSSGFGQITGNPIARAGLVGGQLLLTPTFFVALGTPNNGEFVFCPDCTIANPCAGGGTGALAKRLNGVWVCN